MPFTVSTAIDRLDNAPQGAFKSGITVEQKVQRINEVLERFYELGTWRGLHATVDLTSTLGVITLDDAYQRLDGLQVPAYAQNVPIKSMQWAFTEGGPGSMDWTKYSGRVAIDLGDVSGSRTYQVTGTTATLDALTFKGLARKRFTYLTLTDYVVPECFQALRMGVLALGFEDESAYDMSQKMFADALKVLDGNLSEFNSETSYGSVQIGEGVSLGSFEGVM